MLWTAKEPGDRVVAKALPSAARCLERLGLTARRNPPRLRQAGDQGGLERRERRQQQQGQANRLRE